MDTECPVCYDTWGTCLPLRLTCGHNVCRTCWQNIRVECPICRAPAYSVEVDANIILHTTCGEYTFNALVSSHEPCSGCAHLVYTPEVVGTFMKEGNLDKLRVCLDAGVKPDWGGVAAAMCADMAGTVQAWIEWVGDGPTHITPAAIRAAARVWCGPTMRGLYSLIHGGPCVHKLLRGVVRVCGILCPSLRTFTSAPSLRWACIFLVNRKHSKTHQVTPTE